MSKTPKKKCVSRAMRDKPLDEYMIERFRADPAFAASLLNDILEDGDDQGELKPLLELIAAAGLKVSPVSVAPERPQRKRGSPVASKAAKRPPARRPSARHSAAAAIA